MRSSWLTIGVVALAVLLLTVPGSGTGREVTPLSTAPSLQVNHTTSLRSGTVFPGDHPNAPPRTEALAWDPHDARLFALEYNGVVAAFNGTTGALLREVYVGSQLGDLAVDPANGRVFVSVTSTDSVAILSGATGSVIAEVGVGTAPIGMAFNPGTGNVYVANSGSGNLSVISPTTDRVVGTLGSGTGPEWVAADARNGQLFVSDTAACPSETSPCNLTVIDPGNGTVAATIGFANQESHLAFDNVSGLMYVIVPALCRVVALSGATDRIVTSVPLNFGISNDPVRGVAWDPQTNEVYLSTQFYLVALNGTTHKVVNATQNTFVPGYLAYATGPGVLFLQGSAQLNGWDPAVYRYLPSLHAFGSSFTTYDAPGSISCCSPGGLLYVIDLTMARIDEIAPRTGKIVATWPGVASGTLLADPAHHRLFVAGAGGIGVYNTTSRTRTELLADAAGPGAMVFDPLNGRLYAANSNGSVSVLNVAHNRTVATIALSMYGYPGSPVIGGLAIDLHHQALYVDAGQLYDQYGDAVANVSRISLATDRVTASSEGFYYASGLALDPANGELYVGFTDDAGNLGSWVEAYNATTLAYRALVQVDSVGYDSLTGAWSPATGEAYFVSEETNTVYQLLDSNDSLAASTPVGTTPDSIVFIPGDRSMGIANFATGTISSVSG